MEKAHRISSIENSWFTNRESKATGMSRNSTLNVSWLLSYVARNFMYIRYSVPYEPPRKIIFMTELYRETKFVSRSKYLVVYTSAKRNWDLPEMPAQERVFHIFKRRIIIARR